MTVRLRLVPVANDWEQSLPEEATVGSKRRRRTRFLPVDSRCGGSSRWGADVALRHSVDPASPRYGRFRARTCQQGLDQRRSTSTTDPDADFRRLEEEPSPARRRGRRPWLPWAARRERQAAESPESVPGPRGRRWHRRTARALDWLVSRLPPPTVSGGTAAAVPRRQAESGRRPRRCSQPLTAGHHRGGGGLRPRPWPCRPVGRPGLGAGGRSRLAVSTVRSAARAHEQFQSPPEYRPASRDPGPISRPRAAAENARR